MKRLIPFLLFAVLLPLMSACSDDDGSSPVPVPETARALYILNEGTFQRANASLSM